MIFSLDRAKGSISNRLSGSNFNEVLDFFTLLPPSLLELKCIMTVIFSPDLAVGPIPNRMSGSEYLCVLIFTDGPIIFERSVELGALSWSQFKGSDLCFVCGRLWLDPRSHLAWSSEH